MRVARNNLTPDVAMLRRCPAPWLAGRDRWSASGDRQTRVAAKVISERQVLRSLARQLHALRVDIASNHLTQPEYGALVMNIQFDTSIRISRWTRGIDMGPDRRCGKGTADRITRHRDDAGTR